MKVERDFAVDRMTDAQLWRALDHQLCRVDDALEWGEKPSVQRARLLQARRIVHELRTRGVQLRLV